MEPMEPWNFRTIIEPFRIKMVEPIPMLSRSTREAALARAGHNLFALAAQEVTIDLLTDSGTGAMSARQWAAIMEGDESYAGSRSFQRLEETVHRITGVEHVLPVHQGRAAEHLLAHALLGPGRICLSNTHFDTTRAHVEAVGAEAIDCLVEVDTQEVAPFKGDVDLVRLEAQLTEGAERVALVLVTLTNNAAGGQPVSLANLRATRLLCDRFKVPLFLDAARFAENAWFIHSREPGCSHAEIPAIVREMFDLCDGFTLSAKKDGMVNIGGLLCCRDHDLARQLTLGLILDEGFPTYGGLAGRDLGAMAVGLEEAMDPDYLRYRARSVAYLAEGLEAAGLPCVRPPGGHAVFVDAGRLLPHIPAEAFPGQVLAAAFYLEGGVRGVEIGSLMFPEAHLQLLRLALPRRTYTQAHVNYVVEVAERVAARASSLRGYRLVSAPAALRHFSARLEPIGS